MTNRGFFWLPGVKFRDGATQGDIDVLACCDGHLVFGECKDLDGVLPERVNWQEIVVQFVATAEIALKCNGDLAVLASLVEAYPDNVKADIASALDGRIPYLLLAREDLESGERRIEQDQLSRGLCFYDLLKEPFRDDPIKRLSAVTEQRKVEVGVGTFIR